MATKIAINCKTTCFFAIFVKKYFTQHLFSLSLHGMTAEEKLKIEEKIVEYLRTVVDPEIAIDIYSLGLVYKIDLADDGALTIDMTLTAPNCPMADFIVEDVNQKMSSIPGITSVNVNIVFEPEWTRDMMSEEAKLELGLL